MRRTDTAHDAAGSEQQPPSSAFPARIPLSSRRDSPASSRPDSPQTPAAAATAAAAAAQSKAAAPVARSHTRRNSLQSMSSVPTHTMPASSAATAAKSRRSTANNAGQGAITAALAAASRAPLIDPALQRATEDAAQSASELREERSRRVAAEIELRDTRASLSTVLSDFASLKSLSSSEISRVTAELSVALDRAAVAETEAAQTKLKLRQATEMAAAATTAQRAAARSAEEVSVAAQQSYRLFISTADRLSGITRELVSYKQILKRVLVSLFVSNFRKKQALRQSHAALLQATRCMRAELRKEVSASINAGGGSGHSSSNIVVDPSIELASPTAAGRRIHHEFPSSSSSALRRTESTHRVGDQDAADFDLAASAAAATAVAGPTKRQSSLALAFPSQRPRHITLTELVSQVCDLSHSSVSLSAELTRLKAHWASSSDSFFTRSIELKSQIVDLQAELTSERSKSAGLRRRLQSFEEREAQAREAEANAAADTHPFLQAHSGQQRRHSVMAAAAAAAAAGGAPAGTGSLYGSSSFAPPSSAAAAAASPAAAPAASAAPGALHSHRSKRGASSSWGSGNLVSHPESHLSSSAASPAVPPSNPRRSSAHRSLDASLGVVPPSSSSAAAQPAAAGSGLGTSRGIVPGAEIASVHEERDAATTTTATTSTAAATPLTRLRSQLSGSNGPKIDTTADHAAAAASGDHAHPLTPSPRSASHAAAPHSGTNGSSSHRRPPRRSPYASPAVAVAAATPSGGAARRALQHPQPGIADDVGVHPTRDAAFPPHSPSPFLASHSAHGVSSSIHGIYSQKQHRRQQEAQRRSRSRSPRKYTISRGKQAMDTQQTATQTTMLSTAAESVNSLAVGAPA